MTQQRFTFAFANSYRAPAFFLGITPRTAWVEVADQELRVRFGLWSLRTARSNVEDATVTRDYAFLKSAGPPHLSFTDRGVTFATNGDRGVCLAFREPVPAIEPIGVLKHPGATVTVSDPSGFVHALGLS